MKDAEVKTELDYDIALMIKMGYGCNYGQFKADQSEGFRRKHAEDAYHAAVLKDAAGGGEKK